MTFEAKGIIPAIVTPFTKDKQVNEKVLRELINYLINNGVHGIFILGSQGEFYALEKQEKKRIMEIVVSEVRSRVPVYVGTGTITTRESIVLSKMAEEIGASAVSVITPYFISPSEVELYEHYVAIAKSINLPIVLYNNRGRTGVNLSANLVARLSQIDNIVGIKDSSGALTLTTEYIRSTGDNFSVLAGRDTLILASLLYGGKGAVAASANVAPKLAVSIYEFFIQNKFEEAKNAQMMLVPLRIAFGLGSFPVVIKDALKLIGFDAGPCRCPVKSLDGKRKEELKEVLKSMNLC